MCHCFKRTNHTLITLSISVSRLPWLSVWVWEQHLAKHSHLKVMQFWTKCAKPGKLGLENNWNYSLSSDIAFDLADLVVQFIPNKLAIISILKISFLLKNKNTANRTKSLGNLFNLSMWCDIVDRIAQSSTMLLTIFVKQMCATYVYILCYASCHDLLQTVRK